MDEKKRYEKEDAYRTLEIVNSWISNVDAKISYGLTFISVLMGFIFVHGLPRAFTKASNVHASQITVIQLIGMLIGIVLVVCLYISSFVSIICFMRAIKAKVNNDNNSNSFFFFGTIAGMELDIYRTNSRKLNEDEILEDLCEQIHTNSKICSKKIKSYNRGLKCLFITVILWFVCMVFRLI